MSENAVEILMVWLNVGIPLIIIGIAATVARVYVSKFKGDVGLRNVKSDKVSDCITQVDLTPLINHDSTFSTTALASYVENVCREIATSYTTNEFKGLRRFESHDLYNKHKIEIQSNKQSGVCKQLIIKEISDKYITRYSWNNGYEYISVDVIIYGKEQLIDIKTMEKVGDTVFDNFASRQRLTFTRRIGVQTILNSEGSVESTKCPNCGAPVDIDDNGVCQYCKTDVMKGNFGWVLQDIVTIANTYSQSDILR